MTNKSLIEPDSCKGGERTMYTEEERVPKGYDGFQPFKEAVVEQLQYCGLAFKNGRTATSKRLAIVETNKASQVWH
jgi:hypothetical protein